MVVTRCLLMLVHVRTVILLQHHVGGLLAMTKSLACSRKPLHGQCKDQQTDSQDFEDFHELDVTSNPAATARRPYLVI